MTNNTNSIISNPEVISNNVTNYNNGSVKSERILYTVKEVSQIMHTNPSYVYQLINAGLLPVLKLGSYKVRHIALMKFLDEYEGYDLSDPKKIEKISVSA